MPCSMQEYTRLAALAGLHNAVQQGVSESVFRLLRSAVPREGSL